MPFTPKATAMEKPKIPTAIYDLTIVKVDFIPSNGQPSRFNPDEIQKDQLCVFIKVGDLVDDEGNPVILDPLVNNSLSDGGGRYPASTYYKICTACGIETENGVNSDDLEGKTCKGMIVSEGDKWPKVTQWLRNDTGAATKAASPIDEQALAIARLMEIRPLMNDETRALFNGELCARFPEADSNGQFYPKRVAAENAAEFLKVVQSKKDEIEDQPL